MCPMVLYLYQLGTVFGCKGFGQRPIGVSWVEIHGDHLRSAVQESDLSPDRFFKVFGDANLLPVTDVLCGPDVPVVCYGGCKILLRAHSDRTAFERYRDVEWNVASGAADELSPVIQQPNHGIVGTVQDRLVVQQIQVRTQFLDPLIVHDHRFSRDVGGCHHQCIMLQFGEQQMVHPGVREERSDIVEARGS